jgi:hypothetical protein
MVTWHKNSYAVLRHHTMELQFFPVVPPPWMRNNSIKNVLIQFPCSSHTSFNMYRNSKCLHSWATQLANNFWRLFMPPLSPQFLWHIKVTPHNEVSFVGRMEMFHLLLINNIKNTWMNKERSPEQPLSQSILRILSPPRYFDWDSGDCSQYFSVPEVTDDIKKHALDT